MLIGVSIVNYNSAEKTVELVNRIIEYKIIDCIAVVDNHSADNSWSDLQCLCGYKKVHLMRSDKNGGWSYGANMACKYLIEQFGAKYIIHMTPANYMSEDDVNCLVKTMEEHSREYAVLAPLMRDENGKTPKERIAWHRLTYHECLLSSFAILRKYFLYKNRYNVSEKCSEKIVPVEVVQGSVFMIDSCVLNKIGYYDEDIFLFNEENVLSFKLAAFGLKEGIIKESIYLHTVSYSAKKSFSKVYLYEKLLESQYIYVKKYLKVSTLKLFLLRLAHRYSLYEKRIIEHIRQTI